jgi:hypothetical protein
MSTVSDNDTNTVLLADLAQEGAEPWETTSAKGVSLRLSSATNQGGQWCALAATNGGKVPRNGAWARLERRFNPLLNLKQQQGLSVEVEGDGSGALLAIRLESPHAVAYGAVADRYIDLDFNGRRTFALVGTESTRWSDYHWGDGKSLYNVYRETIDFGAVESASVWLQHLAPGQETKCRLGPLRAVPLCAGRVKDPRIRVDGQTIEFPVELVSGSWIEGNGPADCTIYDARGESLGRVTPRGDWPTLRTGISRVHFTCEAADFPAPRARVTLFSQGSAL